MGVGGCVMKDWWKTSISKKTGQLCKFDVDVD